MATPGATDLLSLVDFSQNSFWYAVAIIIVAPTIWNTLARLEFYTHFLTKVFCTYTFVMHALTLRLQACWFALYRLLYSCSLDFFIFNLQRQSVRNQSGACEQNI